MDFDNHHLSDAAPTFNQEARECDAKERENGVLRDRTERQKYRKE